MFSKILIANRGEIACRVVKTARKMGIGTVAVYSEADRDALHAGLADQAVCIGAPPSAESYLAIDTILAAITETGAEAVHPGYGFLSENADFARRLADAGIVFIGPGADAIAAMGDKITSKRLAEEAGVPTIPGHAEVPGDAKQAVRIARDIGYPVMLKATAGGGGKGMRVAADDGEAAEGFAAASREAEASFGDGRVFVEKFIENPRHIEIQVLADGAGTVIHLGERECSIQRRHQKVIEEAPSPFLDEATRAAMGAQAVRLAKAVGYVSAGTVEFIVDGERNFYFLEMNTRLQVEHPVTEMITGLDLVEWMIRIAAGEALPFGQDDITFTGWAVEARIYAEDPARGFLPSVGRLARYRPPAESELVRVDSGVAEGGEVSVHYDPMIAKLVAHGADRAAAITGMAEALDAFQIGGVSHNIAFLSAVMAHPRFQAGTLSTAFIAEEFGDRYDPSERPPGDPLLAIAVAGAMHRAYQARADAIGGQEAGLERRLADDWVAVLDGVPHPITVKPVGGGFDMVIDGAAHQLRTAWVLGEPLFRCRMDGRLQVVQVRRLGVGYRLMHGGVQSDVMVLNPTTAGFAAQMPIKEPPDTSKLVLSPMPGLLMTLAVHVGEVVKAGQELAVVEAMKMENVLRAERDGVVAALHAAPGDNLAVDQPIVEFE